MVSKKPNRQSSREAPQRQLQGLISTRCITDEKREDHCRISGQFRAGPILSGAGLPIKTSLLLTALYQAG